MDLKIRNILDTEMILLISLSIICFTSTLIRVYITHSEMFLFLNWNLFLAFIPYVLSRIIIRQRKDKHNRFLLVFFLGLWLLFFPNAPYIITDIIHLRYSDSNLLWFDILMVFLFAWTGMFLGTLGLINIEKAFLPDVKSVKIRFIFTSVILFLGAYGIYIGRFLRWNSWDILSNPVLLMEDIIRTIIHPVRYHNVWMITGLLFVLLMSIYFTLKYIVNHAKNSLSCYRIK